MKRSYPTLTWRPELGGFVPVADEQGVTTVSGVEIAAPHVYGTRLPDAAWSFLEKLDAICPCEGVKLARLEQVLRECGCSVRAAKIHTRVSMGAGCQGAFCRTPILAWMHRRFGHRAELEPPPAPRAPLVPVPIRAWVAAAREQGS